MGWTATTLSADDVRAGVEIRAQNIFDQLWQLEHCPLEKMLLSRGDLISGTDLILTPAARTYGPLLTAGRGAWLEIPKPKLAEVVLLAGDQTTLHRLLLDEN